MFFFFYSFIFNSFIFNYVLCIVYWTYWLYCLNGSLSIICFCFLFWMLFLFNAFNLVGLNCTVQIITFCFGFCFFIVFTFQVLFCFIVNLIYFVMLPLTIHIDVWNLECAKPDRELIPSSLFDQIPNIDCNLLHSASTWQFERFKYPLFEFCSVMNVCLIDYSPFSSQVKHSYWK